MRYSLKSRFEGGLLGSELAFAGIAQRNADRAARESRALQQSVLASLIRARGFDAADWQAHIEQTEPCLLQRRGTLTASEAAIALFPVALYAHDDRRSLQALIGEGAEIWLHPRANLAELLLWADAIALVLRGKLPPENLLEKLLALAGDSTGAEFQSLEELRHRLEANIPLSSLGRNPEPFSPLALALYCFAATAEDFSLSLARSAHLPEKTQLSPLLVGAIAGVYNSSSGLPARPPMPPAEGERCQQQARHLFALWSGAYRADFCNAIAPVIAGAGLLQPRPSLKIISHHPPH